MVMSSSPITVGYIKRLVGIHWPRDENSTVFIYKALLKKLPTYLSSLLHPKSGQHHTRSQTFLMLDIPNVNSELGKTAFHYYAPHMWNCLQSTLKLNNLISLECFKRLVRIRLRSSCILDSL